MWVGEGRDVTRMRAPWRKTGSDRATPPTFARTGISRRTTLASGVALAGTCVLAACGTKTKPAILATRAPRPDPAPRSRIDTAPPLFVAREELDVALLQRFYARHGFQPVWTSRPAQANSLVDAVLRAGDQGLDPDLFHATLL